MKLSHLKQIVTYLQQFSKIAAIHRVSDTILKIVFDKNKEIYFNMQRSNSSIFKTDSYPRSKVYNAPFDVVLAKKANRANIESISLLNNDKIIKFKVNISSAYKEEITYIQFEFTGKYTNIIILDQNNIVLEALRHIDLFSSFREVKVGQKLLDIPQAPFIAKEYPIQNIETFLYETFQKEQFSRLKALKKQKKAYLEKKLQKLQKLLNKLDDEKILQEEAKKYQHYGNLILSNLYNIKPYTMSIELYDYDGTLVTIPFHQAYSSATNMAESYFTKSKKAKQKAKNLHIEKTSLSTKIKHLQLFIKSVENATSIAKIDLLFPKKIQTKKQIQNESIEVFWIEGYKVQLGKNEKGNITLLQNAKAKDIWIHMKDRPSTHVLITTDKQTLPQNIIEEAAKLCVEFSTDVQDRYEVDYTQRREVTIQHGANVLYNKYKTIEVNTKNSNLTDL